jgi:outer membrane protein TolC
VLLQTEASARQAVQLDLNQYREGTVDYTTVITAQATALTASQNVLTVLQARLQSSVLLVEDLGGGWSARDLPKS